MTIPTPGDRVVARWQPGTRHGEVCEIYRPTRIYDRTEIAVRWNDGAWKSYDADRFLEKGFGTWELKR